MVLADITLILFTVLNGIRVLAYLPQIWKAATDDNGAKALSSPTWSLFLMSNAATAAYAGVNKGVVSGTYIAEAKATGVQPTRTGGFGYLQGPDNALVEYAGNHPAERFNHVHFYQDDPFCAQLWYQKHLNAPVFAGRTSSTPLTEETCRVPRGPERSWPALNREGMFRAPSAAVVFGDVAFAWYMRQGDRPLEGTRGQLYDHIALSVTDLDAWVAKLRGEGVTFLEEPYPLGDTRAVMIEGPSHEALELVEVAQ
jgi:catechol 2,3-dioxygenase-like lactoylglutathione lyase family enzyme